MPASKPLELELTLLDANLEESQSHVACMTPRHRLTRSRTELTLPVQQHLLVLPPAALPKSRFMAYSVLNCVQDPLDILRNFSSTASALYQ